MQLLWVNLIMDTMGALALATSSPTEKLLDRPPQTRTEKIINRNMWKHILVQGTLQIILLMILVFAGEWILPEDGNPDNGKNAAGIQTIYFNPDDPTRVISGRPF